MHLDNIRNSTGNHQPVHFMPAIQPNFTPSNVLQQNSTTKLQTDIRVFKTSWSNMTTTKENNNTEVMPINNPTQRKH